MVMACLHGLESADLLIHVIGPRLNQSRYQSAVCALSKHINRFRFLLPKKRSTATLSEKIVKSPNWS